MRLPDGRGISTQKALRLSLRWCLIRAFSFITFSWSALTLLHTGQIQPLSTCFTFPMSEQSFSQPHNFSFFSPLSYLQDSSQHPGHSLLHWGQPDGRGRMGVYLDEVSLHQCRL